MHEIFEKSNAFRKKKLCDTSDYEEGRCSSEAETKYMTEGAQGSSSMKMMTMSRPAYYENILETT